MHLACVAITKTIERLETSGVQEQAEPSEIAKAI